MARVENIQLWLINSKHKECKSGVISIIQMPISTNIMASVHKGKIFTSNNNFQLNVLMKLDKIIATQEEHSLLIRRLLQAREDDTGPENPIPAVDNLPDFLSFEEKLRVVEELQRKTVKYLSSLGGPNYAETMRRLMRKIATSEVWAQYSVKGRKGKRKLQLQEKDQPATIPFLHL